ncbi:MAG: hypothetical protein AB7I13_04830 [Vicinamibacterales bacterium]
MTIPDSVRSLERDLRAIFGDRLDALVIYRPVADAPGLPIPTLATVRSLTVDDLRACAGRVDAWQDAGLATPLVIAAAEFARSLDAFPLEFGAILADHVAVTGTDPFLDLTVDGGDLRRACEVQARSHLLHLREGYIEARGRGDAIAGLIEDSLAPLAGLMKSVARLLGDRPATGPDAASTVERAAALPAGSLSAVLTATQLSGETAREMFPSYLSAVEALTRFVDGWSRP